MATNSQKKAQAHMAARDTRPAAHAKYVRISSRKVKIVIDLIRGKNVDDALAILQFTPRLLLRSFISCSTALSPTP